MESEDLSPFAVLLRRYRLEAGLTQEELAERAGLSARAVSDLERGINRRPQAHTARQLAESLALTTGDRAAFIAVGRSRAGAAQHTVRQRVLRVLPPAQEDPELHRPARLLRAVPAPNREARDERIQTLPVGHYLGSLPASVLAGREAEMKRIRLPIDDVAAGEGRTVLLAGEPGAGKTRLAQEATVVLQDHGFLVAAGRCYEGDQHVPYFPFLDALTTAFHLASPSFRAKASRRWPYLSMLLRDEMPQSVGLNHDPSGEQVWVFRAVASFLSAMTSERPIALLVDDLHWSDSASLKLFHHLASHTRAVRLLLLGTYRDAEARGQHPLAAVVRELDRDELVTRITVGPLRRAETRTLLASLIGIDGISQELVGLVYRRTEGNPFFIRQMVRSVLEGGDSNPENEMELQRAIAEMEVPETIRSVVSQRLGRLARPAREILRSASVLGPRFTFDDLSAMENPGGPKLEGALEEAAAAGIVRPVEHGAYDFDHALTHQTLYDELSAPHRQRLHLAAGEAIEQLPRDKRARRVGELARHFLAARNGARALLYTMLTADDATAVFAYTEAERQYGLALDLARESGDRRREAEAAEKLGVVLDLLGRPDDALAKLQHAEHWYRRQRDLEGVGRTVARIGMVHTRYGKPEDGIALIEPAVELLRARGPSPALASLHVAQANLLFVLGRFRAMLSEAERAAGAARAVADARLLGAAEDRLAVAMLNIGRAEEALEIYQEAIPLIQEGGDVHVLQRALNNVGSTYWRLGNLVLAREYTQRSLELAARVGNRVQVALSLGNIGSILLVLGEWKEAREHLDRALEALGNREIAQAFNPLSWLGLLALREGRWEEAAELLREALECAVRAENRIGREYVHTFLAEWEILTGKPHYAVRRLEPLVAENDAALIIFAVLGWAYLESGDIERAEELAARTVEQARAERQRLFLADALWIQGMVCARRQRYREAADIFREVLAIARALPYPYLEARVLEQEGILERVREERTLRRSRLVGARKIFRRLGASKEIERIDLTLRDSD